MKQHFYHYWLRCACVITMLTGLTSLLASYPDTDFLWRYLFNALGGFQSDIQFSAVDRNLSAVLGGVMVGWGWMMFHLVHPSVFNQFIRNALMSGIIVWFLTDSMGSYVSGLPMNIVLNTIFLIIFLIPLISLKSK